jgi:hypothetical protein
MIPHSAAFAGQATIYPYTSAVSQVTQLQLFESMINHVTNIATPSCQDQGKNTKKKMFYYAIKGQKTLVASRTHCMIKSEFLQVNKVDFDCF